LPTNRIVRKRPRNRPPITDEMIRLYARGCAIFEAGLDERWEAEGGRKEELYAIDVHLHRLLGLKLWQESVFYVSDAPAPDERPEHEGDRVRAARAALDAALD
jgi:hypothetical protein